MPAAIRIAKGTHLERLNRNEPQPPAPESLDAPEWVTGEARAKFDELAPMLAAMRVLTSADVDALARYACLFVEWKKHLGICQKGGDVLVMRDEAGKVKYATVSPSSVLVGKYGQQLLRLAQEFGLTPASRTQVAAGAGQQPVDALSQWLRDNDLENRA